MLTKNKVLTEPSLKSWRATLTLIPSPPPPPHPTSPIT